MNLRRSILLRRSIFLSVLALGGAVSQSFADPVSTGTLSYHFEGNTPDGSCASTSRENFNGSVIQTGGSFYGALNFSICSDPGAFDGGNFNLTTPFGVLFGTITASDLGDVIADGIDTETVQGTFLITGFGGEYASMVGYSDTFQATIAESLSTGVGSGSYTVGEVPEPTTLAISSLGVLFLMGLVKRRSRATAQ